MCVNHIVIHNWY